MTHGLLQNVPGSQRERQRGSRKKGLDFFEVPVHGEEGKRLSWAFSEVQQLLLVHAECLLPPGNPVRHCFPRSIIQERQGGSEELQAGQLHLLENIFRHIKDTKCLGTTAGIYQACLTNPITSSDEMSGCMEKGGAVDIVYIDF